MPSGPVRVLVNFVCWPPVGHVIEALHHCHGYHRADPQAQIGLAINADSPTELAALCPYVDQVYPVRLDVSDPGRPPEGLDAIPRDWVWVVDEPRGHLPPVRAGFPGMAAYYDRSAEWFSAGGAELGLAGATPPAYAAGEDFRLRLPDTALASAQRRLNAAGAAHGEPRIGILPAGSAPRHNYPTLRSWALVLRALEKRWPGAAFCWFGKLARDGRTTSAVSRDEFDSLMSLVRRRTDAVDLPLVEQLALVSACDVLVSPHSGFGMAALAVGTPWLSIAGNKAQEYYFNGVSFYSVLPDLTRFPAFDVYGPDPAPVNDEGPRSPSMCYERIEQDLAEIVEGAARLIDRCWPYEDAMADHFRRMLALRDGRRDLLWSVDHVHHRYLPGEPMPSR